MATGCRWVAVVKWLLLTIGYCWIACFQRVNVECWDSCKNVNDACCVAKWWFNYVVASLTSLTMLTTMPLGWIFPSFSVVFWHGHRWWRLWFCCTRCLRQWWCWWCCKPQMSSNLWWWSLLQCSCCRCGVVVEVATISVNLIVVDQPFVKSQFQCHRRNLSTLFTTHVVWSECKHALVAPYLVEHFHLQLLCCCEIDVEEAASTIWYWPFCRPTDSPWWCQPADAMETLCHDENNVAEGGHCSPSPVILIGRRSSEMSDKLVVVLIVARIFLLFSCGSLSWWYVRISCQCHCLANSICYTLLIVLVACCWCSFWCCWWVFMSIGLYHLIRQTLWASTKQDGVDLLLMHSCCWTWLTSSWMLLIYSAYCALLAPTCLLHLAKLLKIIPHVPPY